MSAQRAIPSSWLHDDTEEDLVGADWHQQAIRALSDSLDDLAADLNLQWHVGDQLTLAGTKPDGTPWRPSPDITIYPSAGAAMRAEMVVSTDGVPALIIEVASPSTWQYDVDLQAGKAWGYLHLGVPNYLVFDPLGDLLDERCRGWQQHGGAVHAWRPRADGRYYAISLDVSFHPEGDLLRVYGPDGRPVAFNYEKAQRIRAQERDLRAQARRIADLEAELKRLRGEKPDHE